MRGRDNFKRDLPSPPRRGQDNYTSALVEVESALDSAWHVAPTENDRERVDEWRDEIRDELRNRAGQVDYVEIGCECGAESLDLRVADILEFEMGQWDTKTVHELGRGTYE